MNTNRISAAVFIIFTLAGLAASAETAETARPMEYLDRGLVRLPTPITPLF